MIDTQSLKNKILDLAIRGKLTRQLPDDGTAEELYEKIQAEKQALVEAGKIKKTKPLPDIGFDEIPFEIPKNWKWVRLQELVTVLGDGIHGTPNYDENGEYYFVNGNNLLQGKILIKPDTKRLSVLEYEKYKKELNESTVLVSINGTLGNLAFYNNERIILGKSACYFNLLNKDFKKYIYYVLKSEYFLKYANYSATGVTIKNVSLKAMNEFCIPMPPIAEQTRIVINIEKFFSEIDTIEKLQTQYAADAEILKSKLIDAAIQGKLTEQLPSDGTAEELYQQIQTEKQALISAGKIKKEKPLKEIEEDEIPFEIPESWKWVRFGSISYIVRGGSPRPIKQYITNDEDGINWIKIGDVEKGGKFILTTKEKIIPEGEKKSRKVYPGDFLLTNSMSFGRPYISKIEGCIHDGWLLIHDYNGCYQDYLYYLLSSDYIYDQFTQKASGSTVDNLNIDKVSDALIPLPPVSEQKRIAEKIAELMVELIEK